MKLIFSSVAGESSSFCNEKNYQNKDYKLENFVIEKFVQEDMVDKEKVVEVNDDAAHVLDQLLSTPLVNPGK